MIERPTWQARGLCHGIGPRFMFPENGADTRRAKAICADCPVREACLEYGIDEAEGIWGGTTHEERRRIRARRNGVAKTTA